MKTEQEEFWAGTFGDVYTERNSQLELVSQNLTLFKHALRDIEAPGSILELGANRGLNLQALHRLFPEARLTGVEINQRAAAMLSELEYVDVVPTSILEFESPEQWDLTLSKVVLIHINPDLLPEVYSRLYRYSKRYILLCEYYNPVPVSVVYRGNTAKLFKRDFAGDMLDLYSDLRLVDHGFIYHREAKYSLQDDMNWFLLEKT